MAATVNPRGFALLPAHLAAYVAIRRLRARPPRTEPPQDAAGRR